MGIGSSKQVVDFMLDTCLMRASESSSEKWVRETPANQDGRKSEGSGIRCDKFVCERYRF